MARIRVRYSLDSSLSWPRQYRVPRPFHSPLVTAAIRSLAARGRPKFRALRPAGRIGSGERVATAHAPIAPHNAGQGRDIAGIRRIDAGPS